MKATTQHVARRPRRPSLGRRIWKLTGRVVRLLFFVLAGASPGVPPPPPPGPDPTEEDANGMPDERPP